MSLDDTLGRLQDAAWEHVASLPDSGALSNEHLAGWTQVARAAKPLLTALDRTDLMESIQRTAAAIPARPAALAIADPTLVTIARNLQDLHQQLPSDEASRQNTRDVVALVIQSTARIAATAARDSRNPQVRTMSSELDAAARDAHSVVSDPAARSVPTPSSEDASEAPREEAQATRRPARRDDIKASPPTQSQGRKM